MSEPNKRRIRIEHDGELSVHKMRILDAETREQLPYVRRVEITADAQDGIVKAIVYTAGVEIAATVEASIEERPPFIDEIVDRVAARVITSFETRLRGIEQLLAKEEAGDILGPFLNDQGRTYNQHTEETSEDT